MTVLPVNDPPVVTLPGDSGCNYFFNTDEGSSVRIQGAQYLPDTFPQVQPDGSFLLPQTASGYFQSGFEPWRFIEPAPNESPFRADVGGTFEWDRRLVADIRPGPLGSSLRFFTAYKEAIYFQADDG